MQSSFSLRDGVLGAAALAGVAALAAAPGASCSAETRDFEETGGASSTTTGEGGSGGADPATTSSGAGGTGGEGGAPPKVCEPGLPAYDGPLCGPPGAPCALLADELLDSPPSSRNDAPAVAADGHCAAHVAYSVAEQGFHGFYAHRDAPGAWSAEETPFPIATVSIAAAPDGTPFVLANDGSFGASLWNRTNGQWLGGAAIPGQVSSNAGSLARDAAGVLLATDRTSSGELQLARYDSGWSVTSLGAQVSARVPIALSPEGAPHVAYWSSGPNGWNLTWSAPPGNPEIAAPLGSSGLGFASQQHAIAITPADGQNPAGRPHILFARPTPNAQRFQLAYATRQGAGAWNVFVVDEETAQASFCNVEPQQPGETCEFDFEEIAPLGVVASRGGDVRFLYKKNHHRGTYVSECIQQQFCYWATQTDLSTGQIFVGWLGGSQQPERVAVAGEIMASSGTAALDALGRVHVAVYDSFPPGQGGTTVRYLQIGE